MPEQVPQEIVELAPVVAETCISNTYLALPFSLLYLGEEESRPILIKALAQVLNLLSWRQPDLIPLSLGQRVPGVILRKAREQLLIGAGHCLTANLRRREALSEQDKFSLLIDALADHFNQMASELPEQVPDGRAEREEYFAHARPQSYDPYQ